MKLLVFVLLVVVVGCLAQQNDITAPGNPCKSICKDGLVCTNGTCQYCQNNSQCESTNSQSRCKKLQFMKTVEHLCFHKSLFGSKFSWDDMWSFVIFFVAAAISAGGGIGGGGIFIPILVLVAKFVPKEAVPLSNIIVSGASVANLVQNFAKRHPVHNSRPLIDYSVALLIEPQTLGGTVVGVYLHQMFPSWLILLLLVIAMSLTTIRTTQKAISLFRKEKAEMKKIPNESSPLLHIQTDHEKSHLLIVPWSKIILLIFILIISTVLSFLKGGGDEVSIVGIKACSLKYWATAMAIFPVIFLIWGYEGYGSIRETNRKINNGIPTSIGDVKWTLARVIGVGWVSFLAGILASLLGVGGGLIKGPVLIELGLPPEVVAATSSYMILFTSISASVQYIIIGSVMWDYGAVLFGIGLIASFAGQTLLYWLVERYNRKSYIIFVIAVVIGVSAVLLIVSEVVDFTHSEGGDNRFKWGCPA
eukprot:Phypoly_transcript_07837.p1 GENE.Phypoly_transcript_07837~~Phypoly_transcript_07837.p1  ORF type:complete len:476 (+),score=19.90 Phypoly_transcript_07837:130-1557(+)